MTNVKIYMEIPKAASADVDALLNYEHLKDTFLSLEQSREPTGTEFSEEAAFPAVLPFLLSWCKGTRKHTETRHTLPMLP